MGRYPVTVEEYQLFVNSRAYEESQYWSPEGWGERLKYGWLTPADWDEQLEHPNHPVVNVSWYEAEAYVTWLSAQDGRAFRLPTAEEWAAAATSPDGEYPWGNHAPTDELANFTTKAFVPNVGQPTPVGIYPAGAGPYGHLQIWPAMFGNGWTAQVRNGIGASEAAAGSIGRSFVVPHFATRTSQTIEGLIWASGWHWSNEHSAKSNNRRRTCPTNRNWQTMALELGVGGKQVERMCGGQQLVYTMLRATVSRTQLLSCRVPSDQGTCRTEMQHHN